MSLKLFVYSWDYTNPEMCLLSYPREIEAPSSTEAGNHPWEALNWLSLVPGACLPAGLSRTTNEMSASWETTSIWNRCLPESRTSPFVGCNTEVQHSTQPLGSKVVFGPLAAPLHSSSLVF